MNQSVVVPPLIDKRPEASPTFPWALLPFVFYQSREVPKPELVLWGVSKYSSGYKLNWVPVEDLSKAIASELQNSMVFKESYFSFREGEGDLVLRGTLESTSHKKTLYAYGLSLGAVGLWMAGLPSGSLSNELAYTLKLESRRTQRVLWEKTYKKEHDVGNYNIYYYPRAEFWFDVLMKDLSREIVQDLESEARRLASFPLE